MLFNEPVGDHIVARLEIRLDSAKKVMANDAKYQRQYCFSELHDDVLMFRYCWGDHGTFALGSNVPVPLTLTSEYIENLVTVGTVRVDGRLALTEELSLDDPPRATVWTRRASP
jgi:hypothetical protein